MAAVPDAAAAAADARLGFVPGIEMTAVDDGHDVHILGYWVDGTSPALARLLEGLRTARVDRAREIAHRLADVQAPVDISELVTRALADGGSIARPEIARVLVRAGHAVTVADAFDRFLGEGRPAYVAHRGPTPAEVVAAIVESGGVASLAHPGTLGRDELIPPLVRAGLGAIEAFHSAHDEEARSRYLSVASAYGLLVTGGSDFHGPNLRRAECFGVVGLPPAEFSRLLERAGRTLRV
jgi:predicted metal-dependent phosphoesterase TrpH